MINQRAKTHTNNPDIMSIQIHSHTPMPSPFEAAQMDTTELRSQFLLTSLFQPGQLNLTCTDLDRAIVGGACPLSGSPLKLGAVESLRTPSFLDRREMGIINLGASGAVSCGGQTFELNRNDCLYLGRGAGNIEFSNTASEGTPNFYIVSYPAHTAYPSTKVSPSDANVLNLGSKEDANERTLYQCIYNGGVQSCQLVMGFTELKPGSVWNTMPPHTHDRRSEVYLYFDVPEAHAVLHMMGQPEETRALWLHNLEAVLSPAWSIHCGAGTNAYRFVWAMGGENQEFTDMDAAPIATLR